MGFVRLILFSVLILSLTDCNTPTVSSKKPQKLCIASDFLTPEDTILFSGFRKKEQIKIVILPMSADSVVKHFRQLGYNSKFDLVLMKSVCALDKLSQNEVLHTIDKSYQWEEKGFVSSTSDWMILGINPYVIAGLDVQRGFQYNELTYGPKWRNEVAEDEEFAAFQAAVMFQFGRKNLQKSLSWLRKIDDQTLKAKNGTDSLNVAPYYLTSLSKVRNEGKAYVYPSQSHKFGAFYDGVGVGVTRHSSRYTSALSFIGHYSNLVYNQRLCNRLNILPVQDPKGLSKYSYQNEYPMLFRCTPIDAAVHFRDLAKIRYRIE